MKKIKNLHIMPNDKFNKEFIEFINKNFDKEEHYFILISVPSSKVYNISEDKNPNVLNYELKIPKKSFLRAPLLAIQLIKFYKILYSLSKKAEKVFFHDVSNYQIPFLYFFRGILKKSYYAIWSTEKSKYEEKFLIGKMFKYVKGNFKGYISHVTEDYELLKKDYGVKGQYYDCFMYPSNLYKEINSESVNIIPKKYLNIQIGNSAQMCNNHLEILEKLKKFKDDDIKLFCILSYGNDGGNDYLEKIKKTGNNIFKEKFLIITDFMPFSEYMKFLSSIDISIFAHDTQKAFGNIISLLSMKKTIYLRNNITTYKALNRLDLKVKSFEKLEKLEKFDDITLEHNKRIIMERFSEKRLIEDLKILFNN